MNSKGTYRMIRIIVVLTYLLMIVTNALANILPINGQTTGEVSDKYANLFAPAGYTFSIWGLIYLLLASYVLYQLVVLSKRASNHTRLLNKIGIYFSISSTVNILWVFAWHFESIGLSLVLIILILLCLIQINRMTYRTKLNIREKLWIRLPFSIYFGWITIATIANVTTFLVSIHWDGFGIPEVLWTIIILLIGAMIGIRVMLRNNHLAYGLVLLWAYTGILVKHISESGYNGEYLSVVITIFICLALIITSYIFASRRGKRAMV